MQGCLCDNIDTTPQKILEIDNHASREPGSRPGSDINQKVDVTALLSLASHHRTEKPNIACAMAIGNGSDFFSVGLDEIRETHDADLL